jgi:uncharacterized RDD family membrane protein YckC
VTPAALGQRALAYLLDWVDEPLIAIGTTIWLTQYGPVGILGAIAWLVWIFTQLRAQAGTGQTFGKRIVGITVVDIATLQPLGSRRTTLRWMAKGLDTLVPVRWLQCLRNPSTLTFADQLAKSAVLAIDRSSDPAAARANASGSEPEDRPSSA